MIPMIARKLETACCRSPSKGGGGPFLSLEGLVPEEETSEEENPERKNSERGNSERGGLVG